MKKYSFFPRAVNCHLRWKCIVGSLPPTLEFPLKMVNVFHKIGVNDYKMLICTIPRVMPGYMPCFSEDTLLGRGS